MSATATLNEIKTKSPKPAKVTAETLATKQRDISVSEFFAKNRHLLGFDNPRKALLTTVKEAVDNALDACEEATILPDITVVIEDLQPDRAANAKSSRYRVSVIDNGPGIVRKQVEHIFGRLLYGSKFHHLKMSRGQQGIGISAAGMYGLLTTGKPMVIHTKPKTNQPAHHIELAMNTKTNRAEVTVDSETEDFPPARLRQVSSATREADFMPMESYPTGTSVSVELEGKYQRGRGSVDEFLELTAIANPHARITFVRPTKESADEVEDAPLLRGKKKADFAAPGEAAPLEGGVPAAPSAPEKAAVTTDVGPITYFPRGVSDLPPETKEIQPHPKGIELGTLLQMLREAEHERETYTLYNFLQDKFCRVSAATASALCEKINTKGARVTSRTRVNDVDHALAEKLFRELQEAKLPPPPTDCLAPIGVRQLLAGMLKGVRAEFYAASTREAAVYRGRPFQIEAAIAFGGDLAADEPARVIRFANRVPLLYQQSACSSFKAVTDTNWRNYDLPQPRGSVPVGPIVVMIHMASVWVPFTSESKEAIADYDEIRKEMKLALMECGRKLGTYLRKRQKMKREGMRRDVFERYIGEIAKCCNAISGIDAKKLYDALLVQARKQTAVADVKLDEDGRRIKAEEEADEEGVIIVKAAVTDDAPEEQAGDAPPFALSKSQAAALKVAAMAKDDDDQPSLLGEKPAPRATSRVKAKRDANPKPRKPPPEVKPRSAAPGSKAAKTPAPAPAPSRPTKPKMRLLAPGKLVPIDETPSLF